MTYTVTTLALLIVTLFMPDVSGFSAQRYTRRSIISPKEPDVSVDVARASSKHTRSLDDTLQNRPLANTDNMHLSEKKVVKRDTDGVAQQTDQSQRYGVLLDAGSSSTKVNIFSYTPGELPNFVPQVQLIDTERVKPSLKSFVENTDGLNDYIFEALNQAASKVPEHLQASTPVYVMATAGLRTLSASQAKALLQSVRGVMSITSINPFHFEEDHVSILSGEEEAVYAWLTVNYLHGFFSTNMTREDSVGLLEMGGGSLQVAFLPDVPIYQGEFQLYVGRRRFNLYAHSYLGYGSRYIGDQVHRLLSQNSGFRNGNELNDPCMLTEDVADYEVGEVTLTVRGRSEPEECMEVLEQILEPSDTALCSPKPCAIGNTYQPTVGSLPFYAISAFLYAPAFLGAVEDRDILNITKLNNKALNYCTLTVSEAVAKTGTKAKYASNDCLMGLYIPQLLVHSLGFDQHTDRITVTQNINGIDIHWALGAMIQHLSMAFMDDLESAIHYRQGDRILPLDRARA